MDLDLERDLDLDFVLDLVLDLDFDLDPDLDLDLSRLPEWDLEKLHQTVKIVSLKFGKAGLFIYCKIYVFRKTITCFESACETGILTSSETWIWFVTFLF